MSFCLVYNTQLTMFYLPMCQWTAFWSDLTEQYSVNWDHYYLDVVSNHSVNTHIILDSIIVNVHCIFIIRTFFSRFCSMTRTRDSSQIRHNVEFSFVVQLKTTIFQLVFCYQKLSIPINVDRSIKFGFVLKWLNDEKNIIIITGLILALEVSFL